MKARHKAELLPIECKYLQAGLCSGGRFVQQCSAFSTLKICSIDVAAIWGFSAAVYACARASNSAS